MPPGDDCGPTVVVWSCDHPDCWKHIRGTAIVAALVGPMIRDAIAHDRAHRAPRPCGLVDARHVVTLAHCLHVTRADVTTFADRPGLGWSIMRCTRCGSESCEPS